MILRALDILAYMILAIVGLTIIVAIVAFVIWGWMNTSTVEKCLAVGYLTIWMAVMWTFVRVCYKSKKSNERHRALKY